MAVRPKVTHEVVVLDARSRLTAGFMGNRVNAFKDSGLPLSDLWSFVPLICWECRRTLEPAQLTIAIDFFIRCIDKPDCKRAQGLGGEVATAPPASATSAASPSKKKPKFKVKGGG